jgi:hypothetical protein
MWTALWNFTKVVHSPVFDQTFARSFSESRFLRQTSMAPTIGGTAMFVGKLSMTCGLELCVRHRTRNFQLGFPERN